MDFKFSRIRPLGNGNLGKNVISIHQIVDNIFPSGLKLRTDQNPLQTVGGSRRLWRSRFRRGREGGERKWGGDGQRAEEQRSGQQG